MFQIEPHFVCFKCKPIFLQKIREGVLIFPKTSRSKWWKVYFFVVLVLQGFSFFSSFQSLLGGEYVVESVLGVFVYPWVLVAVFGYAFNKRLLVRRVWEVLFPVAIIADIITTYVVFANQDNPEEIIILLIMFLVFLPLTILEYIVLYRYGFSKTEPWV